VRERERERERERLMSGQIGNCGSCALKQTLNATEVNECVYESSREGLVVVSGGGAAEWVSSFE
jgi:hypothetical protein